VRQEMAVLTREDEIALAKRIKRGDQAARDEFIMANIALVVHIAKCYAGRGMELDDLIQEGSLGLMKAVKRFNYRKGNKFGTFAAWWINHSIQRAICDKSRTIRLPVHYYDQMLRINKAIKSISEKFNREPTIEEIARESKIRKERVIDLLKAFLQPASIESNIKGHDDISFLDTIIDDSDLSEKVYEYFVSVRLNIILHKKLTYREEKIIKMRFGIGYDGKSHTLSEVGDMFGISRERAHQIEDRALKKLKEIPELRRLLG
jgi:RNA polymerase primary sigma factor